MPDTASLVLERNKLAGDDDSSQNKSLQLSDEQLIREAVAGDHTAFEALFGRYRKKIFLVCAQYCESDDAQAHDLCQETFVTAYEGLDRLRDPTRFLYWLCEIARNKCISYLRKQHTATKTLIEYANLLPVLMDNDHQWTDLEIQVVKELIDDLDNATLKETVRLFYVEGVKSSEIAKKLGVSQSVVTTRLNRFRGQFKKQIAVRILKKQVSDQ